MKTNQEIIDIDLPAASKKIVLELLKKDATCQKIIGTDFYKVNLNNKSYNFYRDFTPAIPYMWGIVLSRKYLWLEMLKNANIKAAEKLPKNYQKLRIFITNNYYYNALLVENVSLEGNGHDNFATIIKNENLKRINSNDHLSVPIKIQSHRSNLYRIVKKGKKVLIGGNYDYTNVTFAINRSIVGIAKKIIDTFPGLEYICFEFFTNDYKKSNSPYSVGNILISPGVNIFAQVVKNKHSKVASKLVVENMLSRR